LPGRIGAHMIRGRGQFSCLLEHSLANSRNQAHRCRRWSALFAKRALSKPFSRALARVRRSSTASPQSPAPRAQVPSSFSLSVSTVVITSASPENRAQVAARERCSRRDAPRRASDRLGVVAGSHNMSGKNRAGWVADGVNGRINRRDASRTSGRNPISGAFRTRRRALLSRTPA
jgi:hypothetical protein